MLQIDAAMEKTLADRRSIVMKGSMTELAEVYPRLFSMDQVSHGCEPKSTLFT